MQQRDGFGGSSPTELRNGQQRAVHYQYYGKRENSKKPAPSKYPTIVFKHATTSLCDQQGAKDKVMTNYVHIKKIPDKLYVYQISNFYMRQGNDGSSRRRTLERRADLQQIFEEAQASYLVPLLGNRAWATNFVNLWTDQALPNHHVIPSHSMAFTTSGGEGLHLTVQVAFLKSLDNIRQTLRTTRIQDTSEIISALNAIVTRPLGNVHTQYTITQVGANRIYINEGFEPLDPLRAHRGYFTSVRPGKSHMLLNVNAATSAFFPPCRVSDIVDRVRANFALATEVNDDEIEKWLKGITLRIVYERAQPPKRAGNINDEKQRRKKFKNFGATLTMQRFWMRNAPSNDPGVSVYEYFTNSKSLPF
jgi:hypothetical protein